MTDFDPAQHEAALRLPRRLSCHDWVGVALFATGLVLVVVAIWVAVIVPESWPLMVATAVLVAVCDSMIGYELWDELRRPTAPPRCRPPGPSASPRAACVPASTRGPTALPAATTQPAAGKAVGQRHRLRPRTCDRRTVGAPMTNLVDRLRAALAAEEKVAQRAARFRWDHPTDAPWEQARIIADRVRGFTTYRFTALHTPARSLATIAAHRRIVDRHAPQQVADDHYECRTCSDGYGYHDTAPCTDLRDIASIYLPDVDQGEPR